MIDPALLLIEHVREELGKADINALLRLAKEAKIVGEPSVKALTDLGIIWEAYLRGDRAAAEEVMNKYGADILASLDNITRMIRKEEDTILKGKIRLAKKIAEISRERDALAIALEILREVITEIDGTPHSPIDVIKSLEKIDPETKEVSSEILQHYDEKACLPLTYCYPKETQQLKAKAITLVSEAILKHRKSRTLLDTLQTIERERLKKDLIKKFGTEKVRIVLTIDDLIQVLGTEKEAEIIAINDRDLALKELATEITHILKATTITLGTNEADPRPPYCSELSNIYLAIKELLDYINIDTIPEITTSAEKVRIRCCGREVTIEEIINKIGKDAICNAREDKEKTASLGFKLLSLLLSSPKQES